MNDKDNSGIPQFLKISLDIMIVLGILVFLWAVFTSFSGLLQFKSLKLIITFILFLAGGLSLLAMLYYLRRIIGSLVQKTPFTWSNVKSLRMIALFCLVISICYGANIFINKQYIALTIVSIDKYGIHTDLEFLIFFFAACFIFVLSQVFKQAVEFKEENDLTI
jgi:uncharacterized membrane-anchored protein